MSIIWGSVQRGISAGIEDLEHPWPGGIENGIGPGEGDAGERGGRGREGGREGGGVSGEVRAS